MFSSPEKQAPQTLEDALEENEMLRQNMKAINQLYLAERKKIEYMEVFLISYTTCIVSTCHEGLLLLEPTGEQGGPHG